MIFFGDSSGSSNPLDSMVRTTLLIFAILVAAAQPAHAQPGAAPAGCSVKWQALSLNAINIDADHYRLAGTVHVDCNDVQLFADEAEVFPGIDVRSEERRVGKEC